MNNSLSPLDHLVRVIDLYSVAYKKTDTTQASPQRKIYVDLINFVYANYGLTEIEDAFMRLYLPQNSN